MSEFKKYMHIERFGTTEVDGIELGEVYVFPKLDGTNASAWIIGDQISGGSRKRELSVDADNAGFYAWLREQKNIHEYLLENQNHRLFGEWLVPHTLKTYYDEAWNRFWVFDIWDDENERFIPYPEYKADMVRLDIDFIPPVAILKNPSVDHLLKCIEKNVFMIKDGEGLGEGVVIKNYSFVNRFGNTIWAKIVRNEFKFKHSREFKEVTSLLPDEVEQKIVDEFVTPSLVEKTYSKIAIDGWQSKKIPQLLGTVFHDLVTEESWHFCKKFKMPKVDFKRLNQLTIQRIKEVRGDLF